MNILVHLLVKIRMSFYQVCSYKQLQGHRYTYVQLWYIQALICCTNLRFLLHSSKLLRILAAPHPHQHLKFSLFQPGDVLK